MLQPLGRIVNRSVVVIIDHRYYDVPLGESGTIHISDKVAKIAMPRKRRWVDGTNATES